MEEFFLRTSSRLKIDIVLSPLPLLAVMFMFCAVIAATTAHGQASLERHIVTGVRVNGNVVCYRQACAGALAMAQQVLDAQHRQAYQSQGLEPPDPPEMTKEQVCNAIRSAKPKDCGATRPRINGMDGSVGNGCGSGAVSRGLGSVALRIRYPIAFTGNIDSPIAGASFLDACNGHDACYALQGGRNACDMSFGNRLSAACDGANDRDTCQRMAADYTNAVTTHGAAAYTDSAIQLACYAYHKEMDENGCANK
jgi:hypothetical protein